MKMRRAVQWLESVLALTAFQAEDEYDLSCTEKSSLVGEREEAVPGEGGSARL